jgi:hypothetical protein
MYDILEVLFFHQEGNDKRSALDKLNETFDGEFEVEQHEFVDESRQVVRIIASTEQFRRRRIPMETHRSGASRAVRNRVGLTGPEDQSRPRKRPLLLPGGRAARCSSYPTRGTA